MSVYDLWDKTNGSKLMTTVSTEWAKSSVGTRTSSPVPSRAGENIFNNYIDLIKSKSNFSTNDDAKHSEPIDRPFDFFDDEEFAFGINLLNNNVACVGDNMTKLIQMAQEPWPDNVKLFQPYEVEQILLPDNASCLAVQAFLKMCNLPFEVEMRWNSEFMSPSGRVPFIKCGAFVVSELEPIVQFAANKGVTLTARLSTEEKAEMRAYMSLITNVLVNAELYISWIDNETFNAVTKIRNASVYPWPLGWIQTRAKRAAVVKRLKALHWNDKTLQNVLADVEQCCNSLTQRLGDRDFFFGNPTPLDALLYGHIRALLSATGPKAALMIKPITSPMLGLLMRMTNLTKMRLTMQEEYLVSQAFQLTRRRLSPNRVYSDRNTRARRSKLSVRHSSREVCANFYGFKPFASKKIALLPNMGTCESEREYNEFYVTKDNVYAFVSKTLDEILDKVEEIANYKNDYYSEHHDFEILVYPPDNIDNGSRSESPINKFNDSLQPIDELKDIDAFEGDIDYNGNETADALGLDEGSINVIDEEDSECDDVDENNVSYDSNLCSVDSSNPQKFKEGCSLISSDNTDKTLLNLDDSLMEAAAQESKTTLVMPPCNENVSVDDLLTFLRECNAKSKSVPMPDLD